MEGDDFQLLEPNIVEKNWNDYDLALFLEPFTDVSAIPFWSRGDRKALSPECTKHN